MYKVDREKLSYDLAISFAQAVAKSRLDKDEHAAPDIATDMLFDFRYAYRLYLGENDSVFDMRQCFNSEAPID